MSSVELENKQVIHEEIIPRIERLEEGQQIISNKMESITNQMKAMELSNNDIKQTVVGYGQTHSLLLTKAMESMVAINTQQSQLTREVQTTKDRVVGEIQQTQTKSDSEIKLAKLGTKEKVMLAVLATPGVFAYGSKVWDTLAGMFK